MNLEQLMGRYFRLKQELAIVRKSQPWQSGLISRLASDVAAVEREIEACRPHDAPSPPELRRVA
mgnify:CR=1 FL=1